MTRRETSGMTRTLEMVLAIAKRDRPKREITVSFDDAGDIRVTMTRPAVYQEASSRVVQMGNRFAREFVEMREVSPAKSETAILDRGSVRRAELSGDLVELVMAANAWMYERLEAAT